ncbi:hypothetical protein KJ966_03345 [bacterium]|nr:hypothetical protein [bacterium]
MKKPRDAILGEERIGTLSLRLAIPAIFLVGFQIKAASLFQAIGKARPALILGMSRQLLFLIPLVIVLPMFLGVNGVSLAFPVADLLAVILTALWFAREIKLLENVRPVMVQ